MHEILEEKEDQMDQFILEELEEIESPLWQEVAAFVGGVIGGIGCVGGLVTLT
jgi:hypothetical protein